MGKKLKVGKARKDKYYRLAKDAGYRSRAAFKLLQLNQKFQFLQKSSACVDLCAAPGGWSQVALQYMPISSIIIAIDLVPIKPIHGVNTIKADITSYQCKQILNNLLPDKKADLILHDGAPNVGKNWIHDAFKQAELTLYAFKLATCFLSRGGFFITKMFRSKDYFSILWVFQQMFKKVHATKPQASRNESAEIFVVCQGYLAPDKIDPKFLDVKYVFKDVVQGPSAQINLAHPEKQKKKADGYIEEGLVYKILNASAFVNSENYLDLFKNCTEILIDDDTILNHPLTTNEIKECLKDIQVLGKKELKNVLTWQKAMKKFIISQKTAGSKEKKADGEKEIKSEDDLEEIILAKEEAEIHEKEREISSIIKKKRKKILKEKKKLRDKMALKMILPNDVIEVGSELELFNLKAIKSEKDIELFETNDETLVNDIYIEKKSQEFDNIKKLVSFSRHDDEELEANYDDDDDDDDDASADDDDDDDVDMEVEEIKLTNKYNFTKNPLINDLVSPLESTKNKMDLWFSKDSFANCKIDISDNDGNDDDDDRDNDYDNKIVKDDDYEDVYNLKPVKKRKFDYNSEIKSDVNHKINDSDSDADSTKSENDDDEEDDKNEIPPSTKKFYSDDENNVEEKTGENKENLQNKKLEGNAAPIEKKILKLTPLELAMGEEIVSSGKRKREIVEMAYNRYCHLDDNAPDWFVQEELRHSKKQLPVTKEQIQYYKDKQKAIDANPIKKIAEARARKKNRLVKRLEKARKKSENLLEGMTEKEKLKQTKEIYKTAGLLKAQKKNVTYVVAKKGVGKRVARPAGVKGHYKVVDPRMKKEKSTDCDSALIPLLCVHG